MGHVLESEDGRHTGVAQFSGRRRLVRRAGLAAVVGLLALTASTSTALAGSSVAGSSAASSSTPYLPEPTGSSPVGTTSLHLTDTSRPDPWVPEAKVRELMVSLWYPAKRQGGQRAQYMTPRQSELFLEDAGLTDVPLDVLSRTRTNAFTDVKPAGRRHGLPLVVLSPGHTKPRATLTALAEDLASRGYVVVGIDHTYENVATAFPDGRVTTCVTCKIIKEPAWWGKLAESRAADVSFVLDELTGAHPKWSGASLIDTSRIAMAGHSAGGASSVSAMLKDARIRAGINIDGTAFAPIPEGGLSRPFLFLGTQARHSPGGQDTSWEDTWQRLNGWKRWLVVEGTEHASFTDVSLLAEQFGIDIGADLPATRSLRITRAYVAAFFDLHLRNRPQPLLDQPSTRYPEVKFCTVETKTCA